MTRYMPHRRARYPSIWPLVLVNAPLAAAVSVLVRPHWLALVIVIALAWVVPVVRLRIWRRRHPVITAEQRLDDIRRAAPWN